MAEFKPCPERIIGMVEKTIEQYHPLLPQSGATVEVVFRLGKWKKAGRLLWGTMQVVSGLAAYFAQRDDGAKDPNESFYLMTLNSDEWGKLTEKQQYALIDHELCHCAPELDEDNDAWTLGTKGHDVEEFNCIIDRHGLWEPGLAQTAVSMQAALPFGEAQATPLEVVEGGEPKPKKERREKAVAVGAPA